jgi:hypothetical protein
MPVVTQIQNRRGTAAQWTAANPVLAAGEFGVETDTNKAKMGNGSTAWNSLSYIITGAAGTVTSVTAGTGLSGGTITGSGTIALSTPVAVANGGTGATTSTGSGAVVLATSPTLTTPNIGAATGTSFNSITGLSSTNPAALGAVAVGTGTTTARADHVHPTTGLGLTASGLNQFASTTSSQLAGVISDETGSGALVFGTSPTITGGTFADAIIRQTLLTPTFTTNAYTLVLTDQGDILLASNGATAGTINIPTNASVAFPIGTQITIIQTGAGQLTIQATTPGTTTVASTGATATAPKLRVQNASATLIKTNTDAWYVVGDIA